MQHHRPSLLQRAIRLSVASVAYGTLAGTTAVAIGLVTHSLSLLGFGLDSAIDAAASAVLIWRFREETRSPHRAEEVERWAHISIGVALLAASLYVGEEAIRSLVAGPGKSGHGVAGVLLAAASVMVLPWLARAKARVADQLGSPALRSDSVLTGVAALLAAVALIGILLDRALGLGRADPVAAVAIAVVLLREAWTALRSTDPVPPAGPRATG
jgi:divalent metal cation (Fe/Co/Zn/Cd) transporter